MERKSILVVDDDKSVLEGFRNILQSKGYSVETAETGREAIEKSKTRLFDLALLNIKLPDMEGTKLLTAMREGIPKMVKIMITGQPTLENAVEALNLGADAYIVKPVKTDELLRLVKEKLKEREDRSREV